MVLSRDENGKKEKNVFDLPKLLNWSKLNKQSRNRNWTFIVCIVVRLCVCVYLLWRGVVCFPSFFCGPHTRPPPLPSPPTNIIILHYVSCADWCEHIYDFFIRNWVSWNPVLEKIRHTSFICLFYCIRNDVAYVCARNTYTHTSLHLHLFCMFSLLVGISRISVSEETVWAYATVRRQNGETVSVWVECSLLNHPHPSSSLTFQFNNPIICKRLFMSI